MKTSDFKITQDYIVCKPKQQLVFPIIESDWNRLKRMIENIIPSKRPFQILASISFGIFTNSIFSIIAFQSAEKLAKWVLPVTWSICFVFLIIGIALTIIDRQSKEMISVSTNTVLDEMKLIENNYSTYTTTDETQLSKGCGKTKSTETTKDVIPG